MPITPRLSQKLHETLGAEAAEFVNWMYNVDARFGDVATRGDLAELRQEMRVGFAELRQELARMEARFERRFSDLIKWSFVFWVGAVAAIAMLAGVLP